MIDALRDDESVGIAIDIDRFVQEVACRRAHEVHSPG